MEKNRPPIVPTLPRSLYLETTNRCDSKCRTCIRTFTTLEPPKDLNLAELKQIVDQFPILDRVVLHGIGEPLLNRELFAIIAYLKAKGATVLFNSDAISLTPKRAYQLIGSGLDEYRVSLDAATRETYRKIRGVDQFDRVVQNVRELIGLQKRLEQKTPRVSLWFTAMKANLEELPAFVHLASQIGAREVYVQRLVFYGQGLAVQEQSLYRALQEQEEKLIEDAEYLAQTLQIAFKASGATTPLTTLQGSNPGKRPWAGCQRPWTLSYVTANGNVLPCCISPWTVKDYWGLILGNAFKEDIESIWNCKLYKRFRETFKSDGPPDPCWGYGFLWSL